MHRYCFAFLGKSIFHLFGITLPALRITGGILIFIIGYQMLHGESSSIQKPSEHGHTDLSIFPLAVPILAGPGTIATAMNYSAAGNWVEIMVTLAAFASLCLIMFIFFMFGERIVNVIGESGMRIVTRLMGLILAVVGTQMLIEVVYDAVHTFTSA